MTEREYISLLAKFTTSGMTRKERAITASLSFTILGHLPSMKNSRRILRGKQGKPFSAKSAESIRFVSDFCLQVPPEAKNHPFTGPVKVHLSVWYRSERSDLSTDLVYDCLQTCGILKNDRQVICKHEYRMVDSKNPRIEIILQEMTDAEVKAMADPDTRTMRFLRETFYDDSAIGPER